MVKKRRQRSYPAALYLCVFASHQLAQSFHLAFGRLNFITSHPFFLPGEGNEIACAANARLGHIHHRRHYEESIQPGRLPHSARSVAIAVDDGLNFPQLQFVQELMSVEAYLAHEKLIYLVGGY